MNVKILFFAGLKGSFGQSKSVELKSGSRVSDISDMLIVSNPDAGELIKASRFAINGEFVDSEYEIKQASEIALLPPSSGG